MPLESRYIVQVIDTGSGVAFASSRGFPNRDQAADFALDVLTNRVFDSADHTIYDLTLPDFHERLRLVDTCARVGSTNQWGLALAEDGSGGWVIALTPDGVREDQPISRAFDLAPNAPYYLEIASRTSILGLCDVMVDCFGPSGRIGTSGGGSVSKKTGMPVHAEMSNNDKCSAWRHGWLWSKKQDSAAFSSLLASLPSPSAIADPSARRLVAICRARIESMSALASTVDRMYEKDFPSASAAYEHTNHKKPEAVNA